MSATNDPFVVDYYADPPYTTTNVTYQTNASGMIITTTTIASFNNVIFTSNAKRSNLSYFVSAAVILLVAILVYRYGLRRKSN